LRPAGDKSDLGWIHWSRNGKRLGVEWIPVVYQGFSWDNLKEKTPGKTTIPRRKGAFLWEQFHERARLGVDSIYVAIFD